MQRGHVTAKRGHAQNTVNYRSGGYFFQNRKNRKTKKKSKNDTKHRWKKRIKKRVEKRRGSRTKFHRFLFDFGSILGSRGVKKQFQKGVDFWGEKWSRKNRSKIEKKMPKDKSAFWYGFKSVFIWLKRVLICLKKRFSHWLAKQTMKNETKYHKSFLKAF